MSWQQWAVALGTALAIHVVALTLTGTPTPTAGADGDGDDGIEIGLGRDGSYANQLAQPSSPETPEEPEVPAEPLETPKPVARQQPPILEPEPSALPPAIEQFTTAADDAPTAETDQRAPEPTPEPAPEPNPPSEIPAQEHLTQQAGTSISGRQATGRADDARNGGQAGNVRSYFAAVMAQLNRHKRYPVEAKKRKHQGVVSVVFTIDRSGNVTARSIKKSSGHSLLDQAALEMFDAASPLPPIPDFMQRSTLTVVLPLDFSLITNNAFKE